MRTVKRLKVDNRRIRILTDAQQRTVLAASQGKVRAIRTTSRTTPRPRRKKSQNYQRKVGGRQEDRTPDLRVANAALSQLS